jgi:hypothetical protein
MCPHPTSWRWVLILSSHLWWGLPNGHIPTGFPTKTLCAPLLSWIYATCPTYLIVDLITEQYLMRSTDYKASHYSFFCIPITSSLLCPDFLRTQMECSQPMFLLQCERECILRNYVNISCTSGTISNSKWFQYHIHLPFSPTVLMIKACMHSLIVKVLYTPTLFPLIHTCIIYCGLKFPTYRGFAWNGVFPIQLITFNEDSLY